MVVSHRPWLIDNSALVRLGRSPDADEWAARIERRPRAHHHGHLVGGGYSARSATDLGELLDLPPLARMPVQYMTPASENRAVEVLRALAVHGYHRAPSIPDLLIAATAEQAKLVVLHADKDFELIADVTGQAVERISFGDKGPHS